MDTTFTVAPDATHAQPALLQALLNHAHAVIFAKDLDGRYLLVNQYAALLCGMTPDEMHGKTDAEIFPDTGFAAQVNPHDQQVITAGKALEFEEQFAQEDGMHTYLTVKFPIRNAQGEMIAIGGIALDITTRT
jgi:PAS domain S-box-containing protein